MMYGAMPARPISDLRNNQPEVIANLKQSPIMLTQHGRDAGVLVHPRVWNDAMKVYQMAVNAGLLNINEDEEVEWSEVEREFFTEQLAEAVNA